MKPSDPTLAFGDPANQPKSRVRNRRRAMIVRRHRALMEAELQALADAAVSDVEP